MRTFLALTLVCLLPTPTTAQSDPIEKSGLAKAGRTDRHGDRLPEHAQMRLGSFRLQFPPNTSAIGNSPDSKILAIGRIEEKEARLRFLDVATGKQIAQFGIVHESKTAFWNIQNPVFTPDGKAVFFSYKGLIQQRGWASGKLVRTFDFSGEFGDFALSPDGKFLAARSTAWLPDAPIQVVDVATGRKLPAFAGRGMHALVRFSGDGKRLWSWSQRPVLDKVGKATQIGGDSPCSVCVWETASRRKLHEIKLRNCEATVAFSNDGNHIAVRAGEGIDIINMASGKAQCQVACSAAQFCFTPDGKALVTATDNIRLWDSTTGKLIRRFKGHVARTPHVIGFSADGTLLTVGIKHEPAGDGVILHWNVATGEPAWRGSGHEDEVTCVAWAPDAKTVASGSLDKTVRIWNVATGEDRIALQCQDKVAAIAFSPDGKRLASSGPDGTRLWNAVNSKLLVELRGAAAPAGSLAFTPDGRTLVGRTNTAPFQTDIWELERSHPARVLTDAEDGLWASSVVSKDGQWVLTITGAATYANRFSRMRLRLANACDNKTRLGALVGTANDEWPETRLAGVTLSDDSRMLIASEQSVRPGWKAWDTKYRPRYRCWDRLTGEEFLTIDGHFATTIALSPNNRLLATGHGGDSGYNCFFPDTRVLLWNALDGSLVRCLEGHTRMVRAVAFSPNGRYLVSASADRTLLLWDTISLPCCKPEPPATGERIAQWWKDLEGSSARAHRAFAQLVTRPGQAVPWIGNRVQPIPPQDAKRVQTFIAQLGHPKFSERQRATAALEELTELAEPPLREALATPNSLEQRRRVEELLYKLSVKALPPGQLQALRAVAALEWIGTAKTCAVLRLLAKGNPAAHQTRAARAALERLAKCQRPWGK